MKSPKSVLSLNDIVLLWGEGGDKVKSRINYYVKNGDLVRLRKGIYAKDRRYDKFELAVKIFTPSYISFESVLAQEGIIFQYTKEITLASYLSRTIKCDGQIYRYRKIKEEILLNKKGLIEKRGYWIASKERAFLDTLYLFKNFYFDDLSSLNWQKVEEILPIYSNKRMEKEIAVYKNKFK